ncbi:MAG: hypothetical protein HYT80_09160 [Euryarchaeota archaeon]|nr:hypothetical protein [Euryarchaeota archaeon]
MKLLILLSAVMLAFAVVPASVTATIDQSGDNDGQVTAAEVAEFETQFLELFKQFAGDDDNGSASTGGDFTIDGQGPNKFEFAAFDVTNAEGPVSSTSGVGIRMEVRLSFPVTAGDKHMVHFQTEGQDEDGEGGAFDFELSSAKITAPSGYRFEKVMGLPAGASYNDKSVDFGQAYKAAATVDITMVKGGGSAPAVGPALLAVALAGAALLRRRSA